MTPLTLSIKPALIDVASYATSARSVEGNQPAQSPCHSPVVVPYLFGSFAAMLGLITFALLLLAYSYRRLLCSSGESTGGGGDKENGNWSGDNALVIMPGDNFPRFLATAASKMTGEGSKSKENEESH